MVMFMSIYIHIPFCNSICSYCDFCKVYYNKKYIYDYLDNLKKEISSRYKGEKVNTIFIGGGTPSSLDIDELRYLFDIVGVFDKDIYESEYYGCSDGTNYGFMKVKTKDIIEKFLPYTKHELVVIEG